MYCENCFPPPDETIIHSDHVHTISISLVKMIEISFLEFSIKTFTKFSDGLHFLITQPNHLNLDYSLLVSSIASVILLMQINEY